MITLTQAQKDLYKSIFNKEPEGMADIYSAANRLTVIRPLVQSSEKRGKMPVGRHLLSYDIKDEVNGLAYFLDKTH